MSLILFSLSIHSYFLITTQSHFLAKYPSWKQYVSGGPLNLFDKNNSNASGWNTARTNCRISRAFLSMFTHKRTVNKCCVQVYTEFTYIQWFFLFKPLLLCIISSPSDLEILKLFFNLNSRNILYTYYREQYIFCTAKFNTITGRNTIFKQVFKGGLRVSKRWQNDG